MSKRFLPAKPDRRTDTREALRPSWATTQARADLDGCTTLADLERLAGHERDADRSLYLAGSNGQRVVHPRRSK